ncbi:MAG: thiamine pyrophosphate-binding protein [Acidobacteriota bacterium]|nr:thiamine pyrophosphate-binding protein [Blastocatellia bacterium]MDW8238237.1 thiamine pyrophosphate-binding protein [Acidobacteriota bacterium]
MTTMRGAEALVQCLKAIGTKRVYGVIGTSIVGFVDGLYDARDQIRYISCRHEQVAASMADAEGRLTRRPGVVALHSGPGALNAMISLANAAKDCSPVIAIAGSIKRKLQGCDGMLEMDHVRVFRPLCRGTYRVEATYQIPLIFSQAYKAAMSGPGGPVLIEVPEDIWNDRDQIRWEELDLTVDPPPPVDAQQVRAIAERLLQSARPVILSGAGVAYTHSEDLLRQLAETWQIPVATTGNGRGTLSELHPLSLGRAGYAGGTPMADEALKRADFVLGIGCTLSDMTTYEYTWPVSGEVVVVNLDTDNDRKKVPLRAIYADARDFLVELTRQLQAMPASDRAAWIAELAPVRSMWENLLSSGRNVDRTPVPPARVCHQLSQLLSEDDIVTVGAGMHLLYPMAFTPARRPRTYLSAVNFGAMGFGFPAALAAKLVHPEKKVVAILGDGDFMMTVQDLETAAREKIGVTVIIINDNAYRVLAFRQQVHFHGRLYGTLHGNPDFLRLAESFGLRAWRLEQPDEVSSVLSEALSSEAPTLIEVMTDPQDIPPTNLEAVMGMQ